MRAQTLGTRQIKLQLAMLDREMVALADIDELKQSGR